MILMEQIGTQNMSDPNIPDSYFSGIDRHCERIGAKLRTPYVLYSHQIRTQPTKRDITIELSCQHQCIMRKQAWEIFHMQSSLCRMCQNSDHDELYQLAQEDISDGELTQDQVEAMDEDYYILACLRAKAKKFGKTVGDMVEVWLDQEGKCKECETQLFPTASTRSFYYQEEGYESDSDSSLGSSEPMGVFVCPLCKL